MYRHVIRFDKHASLVCYTDNTNDIQQLMNCFDTTQPMMISSISTVECNDVRRIFPLGWMIKLSMSWAVSFPVVLMVQMFVPEQMQLLIAGALCVLLGFIIGSN
jgi:hypothetical protein